MFSRLEVGVSGSQTSRKLAPYYFYFRFWLERIGVTSRNVRQLCNGLNHAYQQPAESAGRLILLLVRLFVNGDIGEKIPSGPLPDHWRSSV